MIGVKVAAVVLAFVGNWAAASCNGQQEPGLGLDHGKQTGCSSHWTDPNWTWDCGKYKEPGPVATTAPKTYTAPKKKSVKIPSTETMDPNRQAEARALQQYCEAMPNSPDCK